VNTNFVPQIPASSTTFGVLCLATQAGGGLLVGSDNSFGSNTNVCLRFNPDGSRDTSFTNRISAGPFSVVQINSMVPQPDGRIIVGGRFIPGGILRLNTNGSVDATFTASGGVSSGTILKLLSLTNGQVIAVGSFATYAGVPRSNIVRINSNGSIDSSFVPGLGADGPIRDIAQVAGNRFVVGGSFRKFAGLPRYGFAILDSSGSLITRVEFESFAATGNLHFGMAIEPETPLQLLASPNFTNWQVIYSNLFPQRFVNLALPNLGGEKQFFRIKQP